MSDLDVQNINSKTGNSAISIADAGTVSLLAGMLNSSIPLEEELNEAAVRVSQVADASDREITLVGGIDEMCLPELN